MEDGQKFRATVTKKILDRDAESHQKIKMLIQVGDGEESVLEELIAYNELSDLIERQFDAELNGNADQYHTFDEVSGHQ